MLGIAPPGYNAPSMNSQSVSPLGQPGQQNVMAQTPKSPTPPNPVQANPTMPSMYAAMYKSSFAAPSSLSVPSSIPVPQNYYGPPPNALANPQDQQKQAMVQALTKGAA